MSQVVPIRADRVLAEHAGTLSADAMHGATKTLPTLSTFKIAARLTKVSTGCRPQPGGAWYFSDNERRATPHRTISLRLAIPHENNMLHRASHADERKPHARLFDEFVESPEFVIPMIKLIKIDVGSRNNIVS